MPEEEIIVDEDGVKRKIIHSHFPEDIIEYQIIEPSDKYKQKWLTTTDAEQRQKQRKYREKVLERINQLGESRAKNPSQIDNEDAIFSNITTLIDTQELDQIVSKLQWLAGKTFAQVDNYIDNNVTNLAKAKIFLKILAKITLANLKLIRILVDRELPLK
jgi:hypothetical protein